MQSAFRRSCFCNKPKLYLLLKYLSDIDGLVNDTPKPEHPDLKPQSCAAQFVYTVHLVNPMLKEIKDF